MNNRESQSVIISNLRKRIREDVSDGAAINDVKTYRHVQEKTVHLSFEVFVEVFGKIIIGKGASENGIIESLKANWAEQYNKSTERVNYTSSDAAVTTCV